MRSRQHARDWISAREALAKRNRAKIIGGIALTAIAVTLIVLSFTVRRPF